MGCVSRGCLLVGLVWNAGGLCRVASGSAAQSDARVIAESPKIHLGYHHPHLSFENYRSRIQLRQRFACSGGKSRTNRPQNL